MSKINEKRNLTIAHDLIRYCVDHDMFVDVLIYANGYRYGSEPYNDETIEASSFTYRGKEYQFFNHGTFDVTDYIEYGNPDTVTMSFEGPLYAAYNGYTDNIRVRDDIDRIFNKRHLYAEQGYAWSLSGFKI